MQLYYVLQPSVNIYDTPQQVAGSQEPKIMCQVDNVYGRSEFDLEAHEALIVGGK